MQGGILRLVVSVALLLGSLQVTGQEGELYMDRLSSRQGLSTNYVNCIYQDDHGFMWFGTFGGLNRYDGYEVKEYKPDPDDPSSISGLRVYAITGDDDGNLWVGTTGTGLNFYNRSRNTFQAINHDPDNPNSLRDNSITSLFKDKNNRLWIATDNGLSILDLEEFQEGEEPVILNVQLPEKDKGSFARSILEDDAGNIWVSTRLGVYRAPPAERPIFTQVQSNGLSIVSIQSMAQTASGAMILGGGSGLYVQGAEDKNNFKRVGNMSGISTIAYDRETDQLWVGSPSGLDRYAVGRNGETPQLMPRSFYNARNDYSLEGKDVTSIYIDATRIVWAGTSGGGVSRIDPFRKSFHHHENAKEGGDLRANTIRAVYQDSEQRIWIGTEGGGLNRTDGPLKTRGTPSVTHFPTPLRVYVFLEVDNEVEHAMYIGTSTGPGLFRYEMKAGAPEVIEPQKNTLGAVFALLEDTRGAIWQGNYSEGLYRWIPTPDGPDKYQRTRIGGPEKHALPNQIIRSIEEDLEGNIWIGTAEGLARIDASEALKENPKLASFQNDPRDKTSLSNNYVLPIFTARDSTVWVGTFGGGLNRFMPGENGAPGSFKSYGEDDGMIDEVIKAIQEDESGHLWVSTNNGLIRFNPEKEAFENFGIDDGLENDEFGELASCKQKDGSIAFGGVNGITVFYPDAIRFNTTPARPAITSMSVLNKEIQIGEEVNGHVVLPQEFDNLEKIVLHHGQNSISLGLTALHYAAPGKNQLAYKLEGFNKDWVHTTADRRQATYTNLPHGEYTFLLKVSNNDGLWSEEVLELPVIMKPPFWQTNIAYFIYLLMFLGLMYLYRKYSLIDIREKNEIKLKKLDQEKTEELHQLKLQFFTNISHEFRTPLTLIAGPLENLIRQQATINPEQRNQYYHLMYKNSKYLLRLVNELLDFRRLDQGQLKLLVSKNDVVNFLEDTVAPFEFLATKKEIEFEVIAEEKPITAWFSPEALEKILFNLLSNAFKFTPRGGRITVTISKSPSDDKRFNTSLSNYGALLISVQDNGSGISSKKMKRIFDRFYKSTQKETQNREGAGIGLAFTKSLVGLHHGLIDVESKAGEGTTFHLRLPLDKSAYHNSEIEERKLDDYQQQADPTDYFMPEENNSTVGLKSLQQQTSLLLEANEREDTPILLYIDDNPDLRNYIRQSFANDFRVIAADGGRAGLELARTSSPDIIVSDVMMPEIGGMELLANLKADPLTSHIPVILLTAKDTEESKMEGLRHGADGYVTKPFDHQELHQRITNIVQHRNILRNRFRREVITEPAEVTVTDSDEIFLRQAMDIVETNMSNTEFTVDQLVKEMNVSRSKLYLKLKALTGQSSSEFVRTVRLKRAVQLLENSNYSVKEVMYMTGFSTASYFSKCFKRQFGIVPSEYVKRNKEGMS
jgi:signal transduction histidine kinase/ligand-binding sensor domain-containing protein/DNA-binding response OmpR family regulator